MIETKVKLGNLIFVPNGMIYMKIAELRSDNSAIGITLKKRIYDNQTELFIQSIDENHLYPIPLHYKWLKCLGFIPENISEFRFYRDPKTKMFLFKHGYNFHCIDREFENVHDLQNYYFDKYGFELNLKDDLIPKLF